MRIGKYNFFSLRGMEWFRCGNCFMVWDGEKLSCHKMRSIKKLSVERIEDRLYLVEKGNPYEYTFSWSMDSNLQLEYPLHYPPNSKYLYEFDHNSKQGDTVKVIHNGETLSEVSLVEENIVMGSAPGCVYVWEIV